MQSTFVLVACVASAVAQTTLVISGKPAVTDTTIDGGSDADEIHGWNTYTYWDGPTSTGMWPIIRFDLSTLTTADTVTAASMSFYVNNPGNDAEVYKLLCGPINEDTTTWNNVNGGAPFDEAACLGPTKVADACGASDPTSSTACADETPYSFDVTTAVQEWIASPATNYGFIFKPSGGNNGVGIWTSDRIGGADAPALALTLSNTRLSPPAPPSPPPPATISPPPFGTPLTLSGAAYFEDTYITSYSGSNKGTEPSLCAPFTRARVPLRSQSACTPRRMHSPHTPGTRASLLTSPQKTRPGCGTAS